jgi:UDP-N-acetylglucosamine enolpyruvyl transferase
MNGAIAAADGSNKSVGVSSAMTAGTITISNTRVTASSRIFLTHATLGGTQGILSVGTITAGTSFVINSSSNTDTGTVNWLIIN